MNHRDGETARHARYMIGRLVLLAGGRRLTERETAELGRWRTVLREAEVGRWRTPSR